MMISRRLASLLALAVLVSWIFAFSAQAAEEATSVERFTEELMSVLVPVFVTLIGALATWALNTFRRKLGISVSDAQVQAYSALARKAALRGAEWARRKAKEKTEGKTIPGPDVMEVAVNFAISMAVQANLPAIGREKLEALIEAELFELRRVEDAPGLGVRI